MSAVTSLIEAERAFSTMASSFGIRKAFHTFLANDSIIFRPDPVNGKQWYDEHPDLGGFLKWEPANHFFRFCIQTLVTGVVHTAYCRQGLGNYLLYWQVTRAGQKSQQIAGDMPLTLRGSCIADNTGCIHLFEEHGFAVLITQCKLRFDLNQPIPSKDLPDGVTIAPFLSERDNEMRQVFNQAFVGHWIGELSQEKWRERFISISQFRPELTKLAMINNQVVGFYLSEVFENDSNQAWLEIVGVLPEYRGKGLGTALTVHALHVY